MITATDVASKAPRKRTGVPATIARQPGASPALDELTGADGPRTVAIAIELLHPHPANPRKDLGDLDELAESIRAHGVRQNLLVVPDPDDAAAYRIVIGHRRTAAARLAGLATLPAILDTALTPTEQLELMLLENLQRTNLTAIEEADGYQGLLDLGLDEAAIAKNIGRSRATVASRLRLVQLPEKAREAVGAHQATLEDAELLATTLARPEIAARPDLVETLTANFGTRGFAHSVEYEVQRVEKAIKRATATEELHAAGVTVVDAGQYGDPPKGVKSVRELTNEMKGDAYNSPALTVEDHASCEGHVAWVDTYGETHYGCQGWKARAHRDRYGHTSKPDKSPDERRGLVATNKAALAAEVVRRSWIREDLLARKTLPEDWPIYVATQIRPGTPHDYRESEVVTELLFGAKVLGGGDAKKDLSLPGRAVKHLVALAAARVECHMPKDYWRNGTDRYPSSTTIAIATHLKALAAWGYPLAEHEQTFVDAVGAKA